MLYFSACRIQNKENEFVVQLEIGRYDIVGVTESWLKEGHSWELNIKGYTLYQKDRQEGIDGGVALWIRDGESGDIGQRVLNLCVWN